MKIPKDLIDALIATEDERFYSHSGVDLRSTMRAMIYLGAKEGQVLFLNSGDNFSSVRSRNTLDAVIQKSKMGDCHTAGADIQKNHYCISADFNYNRDGLRSAANIYFSKEPSDLLGICYVDRNA